MSDDSEFQEIMSRITALRERAERAEAEVASLREMHAINMRVAHDACSAEVRLTEEVERLRGTLTAVRDNLYSSTKEEIEAICERASQPNAEYQRRP